MLGVVIVAPGSQNNPAFANDQPPSDHEHKIEAIITMVQAYHARTGKRVQLRVEDDLLGALPGRSKKAITDKARSYFGDNFGFSTFFTFAELHEVCFLVSMRTLSFSLSLIFLIYLSCLTLVIFSFSLLSCAICF